MAISSSNQNQLILGHLVKHGYITQLIASNYGVRRLASRMFDLKNEGVEFTAEIRRDDSRVKYAYYCMSDFIRDGERQRIVAGYAYVTGKKLAA